MGPVFGHGQLRLYLLAALEEGPLSGYDVIRGLEDRFGGLYSPSAGTVYPRLAKLEEEGLVTRTDEGRRSIYALTDQGRAELDGRRAELADLEASLDASAFRLATQMRERVRSGAADVRARLEEAARQARARAREADPQADPQAAGGFDWQDLLSGWLDPAAGPAPGGPTADQRDRSRGADAGASGRSRATGPGPGLWDWPGDGADPPRAEGADRPRGEGADRPRAEGADRPRAEGADEPGGEGRPGPGRGPDARAGWGGGRGWGSGPFVPTGFGTGFPFGHGQTPDWPTVARWLRDVGITPPAGMGRPSAGADSGGRSTGPRSGSSAGGGVWAEATDRPEPDREEPTSSTASTEPARPVSPEPPADAVPAGAPRDTGTGWPTDAATEPTEPVGSASGPLATAGERRVEPADAEGHARVGPAQPSYEDHRQGWEDFVGGSMPNAEQLREIGDIVREAAHRIQDVLSRRHP